MSRLPFRLIPVALLAVAVCGFLAWSPVRASAAAAGSASEEEELEHAMEAMNGCVKAWAKGLDASNRDKALEQVAKFQTNVLVSKLQTPPEAAKVEDSKRAEFLTGFRRKLVDVLAASCKLETALIDNKFDDANKVVKQELLRLKKEGHDAYQGKEEHK
jgi:membrane-bound lytic murein transglycosylase B